MNCQEGGARPSGRKLNYQHKQMEDSKYQIKAEPGSSQDTKFAAASSAESPESGGMGASSQKYQKFRRNSYTKRAILRAFKKLGPDYDDFDEFVKNNSVLSRYNPSDISNFIIELQRRSQLTVDKEMTELSEYHKICKLLETGNVENGCKNELPAALTAIYQLELLPGPQSAEGVKFVALYKTLSDLMKGYPVESLEGATRKALEEAQSELMQAVESEKGQQDLQRLQSYFSTGEYDALRIEEELKKLHEIVGSSEWNPFNIPSEFLFDK